MILLSACIKYASTPPLIRVLRTHGAWCSFARANYDHRRTVDSPMWLSYARMNLLASWVAREHGVHFLDVAAASAQRPDGAMARFWRDAGKVKEDCVHYCLPGAVDGISTLVYNWLRSHANPHVRPGQSKNSTTSSGDNSRPYSGGSSSGTTTVIGGGLIQGNIEGGGGIAGAGGSPVAARRLALRSVGMRSAGYMRRAGTAQGRAGTAQGRPGHLLDGADRESSSNHNHNHSRTTSRFFLPTIEQWLNERGASAHLESKDHMTRDKCAAGGGGRGGCMAPKLAKQPWWAFNCTGH